ncbi:hypothetical protein SCP_0402150 [Sparassis crispa]|uniref:Uncharacterized protein n=1 Tax=Sparassis crispa TaxID=139825 RepID=A0A401GIA1_9APHY|nr:hypothetical protein SCP_0402150 [Sparassis crispa]GBE81841.1 hypothetical protein SCP_0402150 [Sparassis crispa]
MRRALFSVHRAQCSHERSSVCYRSRPVRATPILRWLAVEGGETPGPRGNGVLYTHDSSTVDDWLEQDLSREAWTQVALGVTLEAKISEFRNEDDRPIVLTRICLRESRSVTTRTSKNRSAELKELLVRRDQTFPISPSPCYRAHQYFSTHLVLRRLDDRAATEIFEAFTGMDSPPGFHTTTRSDVIRDPAHGTSFTLSSHNPAVPLPPTGIFDYLLLGSSTGITCSASLRGSVKRPTGESIILFVPSDRSRLKMTAMLTTRSSMMATMILVLPYE